MSRDIVEAAKNLVMLDIAMPNAEVAFGLYKNMDEAAAKLELSILRPGVISSNSRLAPAMVAVARSAD